MTNDPQDMEPEQLAVRQARRWSVMVIRRIADGVQAWAGAKLLAWVVAAVLVVGAGIASSLEAGFVVGMAILLGVAGVYLIAARRLLHGERSRRRWAQIAALRADQRRIRADEQNTAAALAVEGHREPGHLSAEMRAARAAARRRAQTGEAGGSADDQRVRRLLARRGELQAERVACEARIQALAAPDDPAAAKAATESAEQAALARKAARDADRRSRGRRRRGLPATSEPASLNFMLELRPDGTPRVQPAAPEPTPEQVAAGSRRANRPRHR